MNEDENRSGVVRGLKNAEIQAQKKLPMVVDNFTILTKVSFIDNDTPRMEYVYKVGFTLQNIKDDMGFNVWANKREKELIKMLCDRKLAYKINVEFAYKYIGRNEIFIGEFVIKTSDCSMRNRR